MNVRRIIAIIIIIILTAILGLHLYSKKNDSNAISQYEWDSLLAESFDRVEVAGSEDEIATGEYIAKSAMSLFNERHLRMLGSFDVEVTDTVLINIAIEQSIISRSELHKGVTEERAIEIKNHVVDVYCNPDTYPTYDESEYGEDVVFTDSWNIEEINEDVTNMRAVIPDEEPYVGQIIVFKEEDGIVNAREISDFRQIEGNEYDLVLGPIEKASDLATVISCSGCADFSYINSQFEEDLTTSIDKNKQRGKGSFFNALTVEAKENKSTVGNFEIGFEIDFGGNVKVHRSTIFGGKVEAEKTGKTNSGTMVAISGNLKLTNFTIVYSGWSDTINPLNPNNDAEFIINTDVDFDIDVKKKLVGEFPIGPAFTVPIAGGVVSANVQIVGVFELDGSFHLEFEMGDARSGIQLHDDDLSFVHDIGSSDISAKAEGTLTVGPRLEFVVVAFDKAKIILKDANFELLDPGIEAKVYVGVGKNTESPGCLEEQESAPLIDILLSSDGNSILGQILKHENLNFKVIIWDEDSAPFKSYYHIEFDDDGKWNFIKKEGPKDDVCTKKGQKEPAEKTQKDVDTEVIAKKIDYDFLKEILAYTSYANEGKDITNFWNEKLEDNVSLYLESAMSNALGKKSEKFFQQGDGIIPVLLEEQKLLNVSLDEASGIPRATFANTAYDKYFQLLDYDGSWIEDIKECEFIRSVERQEDSFIVSFIYYEEDKPSIFVELGETKINKDDIEIPYKYIENDFLSGTTKEENRVVTIVPSDNEYGYVIKTIKSIPNETSNEEANTMLTDDKVIEAIITHFQGISEYGEDITWLVNQEAQLSENLYLYLVRAESKNGDGYSLVGEVEVDMVTGEAKRYDHYELVIARSNGVEAQAREVFYIQ